MINAANLIHTDTDNFTNTISSFQTQTKIWFFGREKKWKRKHCSVFTHSRRWRHAVLLRLEYTQMEINEEHMHRPNDCGQRILRITVLSLALFSWTDAMEKKKICGKRKNKKSNRLNAWFGSQRKRPSIKLIERNDFCAMQSVHYFLTAI